jgi:hypothetical protein
MKPLTIYSESTAAHLQFDWKEVDCFFRPQAVVCDRIGPGYGLLFLYLASFHKMFEFRGGLERAGDAYFSNMQTVLAEIAGLELQTRAVPYDGDITAALKELPLSEKPVIIPVNIRALPWYRDFQKTDQVHYLIVTDDNEADGAFTVLDNLQVDEDNESRTFAPLAMPGDLLSGIAELYRATYLDRNACYWILTIERSGDARRKSENEISLLVLSEYLQPTLALRTSATVPSSLDARYLQRLQGAHDLCDMAEFEVLMRSYLAATNFANVSLKLLAQVANQRSSEVGREVSSQLDQYLSTSSILRSKLMVKCLITSHTMLPPGHWSEAAAEFTSLSDRLQERLSNLIAQLDGE